MKKVIFILAFIFLPLITLAQAETTTAATEISVEKDTKETTSEAKSMTLKADSNSTAKSQLLKINRKKSSEIISIKAYRKSLQIKVKEVKLC